MRSLAALALLLVALGNNTNTTQDTDAAQKDLEKFQGQWVMAALEVNGSDVDLSNLDGTVLTVMGDSYVVKIKDQTLSSKITVDPAKDPREIDMFFTDGANKDKVQKGIYTFKNKDTFQISRGLYPDQNRPRDFASWPNSSYLVVTWKKKD